VVFGLAAVLVLPSLGLLYVLDQKGLLPEESTGPPVPRYRAPHPSPDLTIKETT
jgi:hypothetical protein